jgi:cyanophycinase
MNLRSIFFTSIFSLFVLNAEAQTKNIPKGNLFIIGGGDKSAALINKLISTAKLSATDYIAVLPMSSAEPDSSFYYIRMDIMPATNNTIANLNFTPDTINDTTRLDSLKHAKLIYITGGDQNRFMKAVLHTPVFDAIHYAYENGSTIAGTSAGAAVMNKYMITGNQLLDTAYSATFDKLRNKNIEITEGLGLIDNAIVDQHFIIRSRYNRLLSALALHPDFLCIGVDEGTAIIVHEKIVTVAGDSQVITFTNPRGLRTTAKGLIKFGSVVMHIYTDRDRFMLR